MILDGEAVKREILTALEYSYAHDDWVEPLPEALAGVMPQEAAWQPDPNGRSIWAIVLHLALWHENMVARMQSGRPVRPEEGSWPALPPVLDEAAWEHTQKRLGNSLDALRAQIKSTPPEALLMGPYGMADLLCRFTHNGYHIGQIVKLREWRAAQNTTV